MADNIIVVQDDTEVFMLADGDGVVIAYPQHTHTIDQVIGSTTGFVLTSDARLTNTRTPTAGTVTDTTIVAGGLSPSKVKNLGTAPQGAYASVQARLDAADTADVGKAVDTAVVHNTGAESIAGVKTFSSPPIVPTPVNPTDAANKTYVDTAVSGLGGGGAGKADDTAVVHNTGNENVAGIKTFASSPVVPLTPTTTTQAASKGYVDTAVGSKANDSAAVHVTGNETVGGIKTFSSPPVVPTPSGTTDAANKTYVDTAVGLRTLDTAAVHNTGNETVSGVKTFSVSPIVPTPTTSTQVANKSYVDGKFPASPADKDVLYYDLATTSYKSGRVPTFAREIGNPGPQAVGLTNAVGYPVLYPVDVAYLTGYLGLQAEGADFKASVLKLTRSTNVLSTIGQLVFTAGTVKFTSVDIHLTPVTLNIGDLLFLNIDQTGSTTTGADLVVEIHGSNATLPTVLSAPGTSTLTATVAGSDVNLSWTAASGTVFGYNIYVGGNYLDTTYTTSYTDIGAALLGKTYTVKAFNIHLVGSASNSQTPAGGADYVFVFTGTAGNAINTTDWPTSAIGSATGPAPSVLVDGSSNAQFTTGATGGFSVNDAAKYKSRIPTSTNQVMTIASAYTQGNTNGNALIYWAADNGTTTGPATDYLQVKFSSSAVRIGYRKSSGSFVTVRTFSTTHTVGTTYNFEIHSYVSAANTIIEYREWVSPATRPGTATTTDTIATSSIPTAGGFWIGTEGPSSASSGQSKLAEIDVTLV